MTHAESQQLLLDLAFGELDPARAAEVEAHLAGCEECRREKAALDQARRAAAPLRELEEPSADFDERILAAARAQAQLTHDGNIGKVIEVQGSVQPLQLKAAGVDTHGKIALQERRRRPRWALRVALGGSVAAAAALALVVSTTLQSRQEAERARIAAEKPLQINVQPAPVPAAASEAVHEAKKDSAPAELLAGPRPAPAPPPDAPSPARVATKAQRAPPELARDRLSGSGGDAQDAAGAAQPRGAAPLKEESVALKKKERPAEAMKVAAEGSAGAVSALGAPLLERDAQQARHSGDYLRAADLYRRAAAERRSAGQATAEAAWDLAHAVECLAAVGRFDEARRVRSELEQLYPSEKSAFLAASRALREADTPGAVKSKDAP